MLTQWEQLRVQGEPVKSASKEVVQKVVWGDLIFPPINLWSIPRLQKDYTIEDDFLE